MKPSLALSAAAALLLALAGPAAADGPDAVKVFSSAEGAAIPFDAFVAAVAADSDVVFVGEQHDDPATHRLELALLTALHRKRPRAAVSLEMFERDTQTFLDAYLAGSASEEVLAAHARPWPNYATDYRPLVEYAKANALPVIASNVPRRLSTKVATGKGLAELASMPAADAQWVAGDVYAPRDRYWLRFRQIMRDHAGADEASMFAFYEAQVVKDETMAESIARFVSRTAKERPLVVHFTGAFHTDYAEGTALRVRRRLPAASAVVVTIVPADDPQKADGAAEAGRADYVIFVPREAKPAAPAKT